MRAVRVLAVALMAACAQAPAQQNGVTPRSAAATAQAVESIRPVDFFGRIGFLASDALGGRDTPSQGLEAAAAYIASEFHRFGLETAGDPGSYIQRWPYTTRVMDVAGTHFEVDVAGSSVELAYRTDFYAQPAARGTFSGGLVFTGSDVPAAAVQESTLRGRAALVAPESALSPQAIAHIAARADSAGAGALVIVLGPDVDVDAVAAAARQQRRPGRIPTVFVRQTRARELFRSAGLDLDALIRAGAPRRAVELPGATAHIGAGILETEHQVPNVAGVLRGSDPALRDTYIVFSAHIDHVGSNCRGITPADTICNGADDDASGTSAIIELAEAFAMLPTPPKRSLLFLGASGEEKGLLGSRYFSDNPTVPIDRMVANINIDMIGRNHPDSVVAIGQQYSTLGPLLHEVNRRNPELRMTVSEDLWPQERFFFRSDHFNFARREVPAIFFFTGTHEDYHGAGDHVEKIDLDKITRITRLIFHYGMALAEDPERPQWDPAGLEEVRRLVRQGR